MHYYFIQDVITKWNSTFYMVDRVLEQQQSLCAILIEIRRPELMPTDGEILEEVMKPVAQITETMGGEKHVALSSVRPFICKLLNKYLEIEPSDSRVKKEI